MLINSNDTEFSFESVDALGLEPEPQQQQTSPSASEFSFEAVDKVASKPQPKKKVVVVRPGKKIPLASATTGGQVSSGYGSRVPPKKGASSFHQAIDINADEGDPVPSSGDGIVVFAGRRAGKGLSVSVRHLDGRETEYNHLSKVNVDVGDRVKLSAILGSVGSTGVSTGPHLDYRVKDVNGNYVNPVDELTTNPQETGTKLELNQMHNPADFSFESVDQLSQQTSETKPPLQEIPITDPSKVDFQVGTEKVPGLLHWMVQNNQPKILRNNPLEVGNVISAPLDWSAKYKSGRTARPDANSMTDAWLAAWNPEYAKLNQQFRQETGGLNIAVVDSEKNLDYKGKGIYEVKAMPTRGVKALFEAYKQNGLAGFNATNKLINEQIENVSTDYQAQQENFKQKAVERPYLSKLARIASPVGLVASELTADKRVGESAAETEAAAITNLSTNLQYLSRALYTGNIYGYDSPEYLNLIQEEKGARGTLEGLEERIYSPPTFAGKFASGALGGLISLPRFAVAGQLGGASLPLMVYLENLHKGNREAAMQALPMALMVGGMHGGQKFLSGQRLVNKNVVEGLRGTEVGEEFGSLQGPTRLVNRTFAEETGGTSAPFRRVARQAGKFTREDLSLFQENMAKATSPTVENLTPLARQFVLRGANATLLAGSGLISGQSLQDTAASFLVGLTFPVGKGPKRFGLSEAGGRTTAKGVELNYPKPPLQLGPARIDVPMERFPTFGPNESYMIDQTRENPTNYLPSGEVGWNKYGERFAADIETGYMARGTPPSISLPIDTAALHLLELRRTLADQSYKTEGEDFSAFLFKQHAIQDAIEVLERKIPEETMEFFETNEEAIRSALKGNWDANRAAAEQGITNVKQEFEQSGYSPDQVRPRRFTEPVYKEGKLREDVGQENVLGTNKGRAENILNNFRKIPKQGTSQATVVPYGDVLVKKAGELAYLSAFFMEDYYHRGIEPRIDMIANRMREALGAEIPDEVIKNAYDRGADYLNSNVADPFFSRMKQDATEKLPNKFNSKQARDILGAHPDEFEWTAGLQQFLNEKEAKGEKITKQELVALVQRGQVRVEESIAQDKSEAERQASAQQITDLNKRINELYNIVKLHGYLDLEGNEIAKYAAAKEEMELLMAQRNALQESNKTQTQWSLKAYPHEKLELEGAQESREVKLISAVNQPEQFSFAFKNYLDNKGIKEEQFRAMSDSEQSKVLFDYDADFYEDTPKGQRFVVVPRYRSPHWNDLADVVAHYRTTFRQTVDGSKMLFSEEFQSDWAHSIRVAYESILKEILFPLMPTGADISHLNSPTKLIAEIKQRAGDSPGVLRQLELASGTKGNVKYIEEINNEITPRINELEKLLASEEAELNRLRKVNLERENRTRTETEEYRFLQLRDSTENIREKIAIEKGKIYYNMEKFDEGIAAMPFMDHVWKELVMKRFLRDAATTKNPDGSYKYDTAGWTTARQQMERYGKILEGKDFSWRKDANGTYSFILETSGQQNSPHELQYITLERFAELTTPEAAQEVRDQEAKTFEKYKVQRNRSEFIAGHVDTMEEAIKLKNNQPSPDEFSIIRTGPHAPEEGKFSLKEAVEIRKGGGEKYSDYDQALVNIAKKIAKKYGAKYTQKEIITAPSVPKKYQRGYFIMSENQVTKSLKFRKYVETLDEAQKEVEGFLKQNLFNDYTYSSTTGNFVKGVIEGRLAGTYSKHKVTEALKEMQRQGYVTGGVETVHSLELTPAMRTALEREGLPLYGTGGNEPLKNKEPGIRNRIVSREAFDTHRNELVKAIENSVVSPREIEKKISESNDLLQRMGELPAEDVAEVKRIVDARREELGNVFNSGLNPDALIDQFKLLYRGINDFQDFSAKVIKRFGEQIRPFLQDLWIQVKDLAQPVGNAYDDLMGYILQGKDSPAFKSRQFSEGGFLGLGTKASQDFRDYKKGKKREGIFRILPPKLWRATGLAQADTDFNEVHKVMRYGQRAVNSYENSVIDFLRKANNFAKLSDPNAVAEIIFQGNENGETYTSTELLAKGFDQNQIEAYNAVRQAEDLNLDWRKDHFLYNMRERADQLNDKLSAATPNSAEYNRIVGQLLDLNTAMGNIDSHYQHLKNSGYISLQRQGKIVAQGLDANGNKIYQHFNTAKDANNWVINEQAKGATNTSIYDLRKPQDLSAASKNLTPGEFEDLVEQAGVNPNTKEINDLRDEVYSRYPSYAYQLKRDFTPGYDRNWKFALSSVARQTETYANSFYSRVGGNEAMKKLNELNIYESRPEVYDVAKKFIDDEISVDRSAGAKAGGLARKAVYMINLGGDLNQLYLNAIAQPITQTYSYFSRLEHNGIRLGPAGAEKYFMEAAHLVNKFAANEVAAKLGQKKPFAIDPEFEQIYETLRNENVIKPEFNKSLLESEAEKSVQGQLQQKIGGQLTWNNLEHWASTFMRAGEKTTRTHAAAEAYLVGKNKFGMSGDELTDFIVRAVDATQSNPSRAEAPYYVRHWGEAGKLLYQFNAFNHMWLENLALNVRSDWAGKRVSSTARHLAPLAIMGGIKGLPLSGFAFGLYTLLTGDDIKKEYFDKWFKNNDRLGRMAMYGVTGSPAISQKVTPAIPFVDTFRLGDGFYDTFAENLSSSTIPAVTTAGQFLKGLDDVFSEGEFMRGVAGVMPRAIRGPINAIRTGGLTFFEKELIKGEGYKTRGGETILNKKNISAVDTTMQFFNITPVPISEYYDEKRLEDLKAKHEEMVRKATRLNRQLKRLL
jgi:Peptidase family M23